MTLTPTQRRIAQYLVRGLSNKEIAREIGLSHYTVRDHILKAAQRLGVRGRMRVALHVLKEPA